MRVLLSEGSGLTSRQVATRLGQLGHELELLSSSALCLSRFTRQVSRVHAVPSFGVDPLAWFDTANAVVAARSIDMLFPTQEQVTVLSARCEELGTATVVPTFQSLRQVQDKVSAHDSLAQIGLPQPVTVVARSLDELAQRSTFPCSSNVRSAPRVPACAALRRGPSSRWLQRHSALARRRSSFNRRWPARSR